MSHYDYKVSQQIEAKRYPFYALLMALMRQADADNLELLEKCWPEVFAELQERYNAPGGFLKSEIEGEE